MNCNDGVCLMSLEAELKSRYSQVHRRLLAPLPPPPKAPLQVKLSPQLTDKKSVIHIPIRTWDSLPRQGFPQEYLPTPVRLAVILKLVAETERFSILDLRSRSEE